MKQFKIIAVILCITVFLPGCLKTRSQIKGNDTDSSDSSESGESASTPPAKSPSYDMEEMKNEITSLGGKLDDMDYRVKNISTSELKDTVASLNNRVTELEKNQLLMMTELKALKDKQTDDAKVSNTSTKTLLAEGGKLLAAKKYDEAGERFRAVVTKSPKGKDAAEAHYSLGEVEYSQKNYKKAIVEFSKVQDVSAGSPLVPSSLYRIGLCFTKLGMQKEARGFFSELVEKFPKSGEAKKARAKLKDSDAT